MDSITKTRMQMALKLAKKSLRNGDVPVGCVIFDSNKNCIGTGFNSCIKNNDPSAHAEVLAIRNACKHLNTLFLTDVVLYVTLEPCSMCEALIKEARIKKVFFGAYNLRKEIKDKKNFSHIFQSDSKYRFYGGFEEESCAKVLKEFFAKLR